MTLPAFSAAGTGSETSAAWPTHASGDFGLLCVETNSGTVTTPSGWTPLIVLDSFSGNFVRLVVFRRFATSSSEGAPSLSGGNNHLWGTIITYTGVNTNTPIHSRAVQAMNAQASHWLPGLTTFVNDCMIVKVAAYNNDSAGPLFSGETDSTLGSLAERYDAGTTTNNGGGIYVVDGTLATKGVCGPTQVTMSTGGALIALTLALQGADITDVKVGRRSRVVNTGM